MKISWQALEYEEKERTEDWFWALAVIIVTGSLASIIFENYFFALLLIVAGTLLWFFAHRKPETLTYELNDAGLAVRHHIYPWESIKAFWVQADFSPEPAVKPLLFIHSERIFMPIVSVPIELDVAEDIHRAFSEKEIPEVEMKEHPAEKIMGALGF